MRVTVRLSVRPGRVLACRLVAVRLRAGAVVVVRLVVTRRVVTAGAAGSTYCGSTASVANCPSATGGAAKVTPGSGDKMRRVTAVPLGPWVTTVSTGSLVIWRVTAVWAWAIAVPDASAKPNATVPMRLVPRGLIAKPPVLAKQWPNVSRPWAGSGAGRAEDFGA